MMTTTTTVAPDTQAKEHIYMEGKRRNIKYWFYGFFALMAVVLFLPWTQNIRAKGNVIPLRQENRPQQINTIIAGKIVKWWVREGDLVKKGDTLIQLSEVKEDYLDPELLERTKEQLEAKKAGIEFYKGKAQTAGQQVETLRSALQLKLDQLDNKIQQTRIKLQSDSIEAKAAANEAQIAARQFERQQSLFDSGLVSRTQLEQRDLAFRNTQAKRLSAENKYINTRQELIALRIEKNSAQQEYAEKMQKAEGDRFESLSAAAAGEGEVAKLQNQYSSYSIRNNMYIIMAPQDGQVVQAKRAGIGEVIKEGETILNIVPEKMQYAVEMFVRPVDLPLIQPGQRVMFLFDGFPAIVFSGWPQASSGTFKGKIVVVERSVSDNGRFRVLVAEDPTQKPWPRELKIGAGANGFALLNDVPVWYELWRNINSFPPDFYNPNTEGGKGDAKTAKK